MHKVELGRRNCNCQQSAQVFMLWLEQLPSALWMIPRQRGNVKSSLVEMTVKQRCTTVPRCHSNARSVPMAESAKWHRACTLWWDNHLQSYQKGKNFLRSFWRVMSTTIVQSIRSTCSRMCVRCTTLNIANDYQDEESDDDEWSFTNKMQFICVHSLRVGDSLNSPFCVKSFCVVFCCRGSSRQMMLMRRSRGICTPLK